LRLASRQSLVKEWVASAPSDLTGISRSSSKSEITLVRGERGREKLLEIRGPEAAGARQTLLDSAT